MSQKRAIVIVERKLKFKSGPFWELYVNTNSDRPKRGEIDLDVRSAESGMFLEGDGTSRDKFIQDELSWYNIDNVTWPKYPELFNTGEVHSKDGVTCEEEDVCICGPIEWRLYNNNTIYLKKINFLTEDYIKFYKNPHLHYKKRLQYCRENFISVHMEDVECDDHWDCDLEWFDSSLYKNTHANFYEPLH